MLDKLLSPFIGYWYWAQDRATPATKALALGAPLVVFGLMLYLLFGRDDGSSSLMPDIPGTQGNIAVGTERPASSPAATQPPITDVPTTATGGATGASTATETAPTGAPQGTAFAQQRYTVVSGDSPGAIAEKVGVPAEVRNDWIEEMLALNGVTATTLQVGQELILPPF